MPCGPLRVWVGGGGGKGLPSHIYRDMLWCPLLSLPWHQTREVWVSEKTVWRGRKPERLRPPSTRHRDGCLHGDGRPHPQGSAAPQPWGGDQAGDGQVPLRGPLQGELQPQAHWAQASHFSACQAAGKGGGVGSARFLKPP